MKRTMIAGIVLVCSLTVFGCASGQYASYDRGRSKGEDTRSQMTNHDVIALSKAGVSDSVIITMMNVTASRFKLNTGDVITLADSGVSHDVINAMLKTQESSTGVDRAHAGYYYPPDYYWYAYDPFWGTWYDPFWYGWYYPAYTVRLGYSHYGGFGGHRFGGGHHH